MKGLNLDPQKEFLEQNQNKGKSIPQLAKTGYRGYVFLNYIFPIGATILQYYDFLFLLINKNHSILKIQFQTNISNTDIL